MALPAPITLTLNGAALGKALTAKFNSVKRTTDRYHDYIANKACGYIALRAAQNMPRVKPWAIDQELEVSAHGITATGNLSRAKKPRRVSIGSHPSSLASRIILASFYSTSKYNLRTGRVYARAKPDTTGAPAFWQWISDTAARMVKTRHSAAGFFASVAKAVNVGFGAALGKIPGITGNSGTPLGPSLGGIPLDANTTSKMLARGLARVTPATTGSGIARFSVATTEPDTKGRQAEALKTIAQPVWQGAVDAETSSIMAEIQRRYAGAFETAGLKVS